MMSFYGGLRVMCVFVGVGAFAASIEPDASLGPDPAGLGVIETEVSTPARLIMKHSVLTRAAESLVLDRNTLCGSSWCKIYPCVDDPAILGKTAIVNFMPIHGENCQNWNLYKEFVIAVALAPLRCSGIPKVYGYSAEYLGMNEYGLKDVEEILYMEKLDTDLYKQKVFREDNPRFSEDGTRQFAYSDHTLQEIGSQILLALFHLHSRGLLHRDMKLANIMVRDSNVRPKEYVLIDYGTVYAYNPAGHAFLHSEPWHRGLNHEASVDSLEHYYSRPAKPINDVFMLAFALLELSVPQEALPWAHEEDADKYYRMKNDLLANVDAQVLGLRGSLGWLVAFFKELSAQNDATTDPVTFAFIAESLDYVAMCEAIWSSEPRDTQAAKCGAFASQGTAQYRQVV